MKRIDKEFRDVTDLPGLWDESDKVILTVEEWRQIALGMKAVDDLLDESQGVYGLHLNGDLSSWSELRTGGRHEEWLVEFDQAMAAVPEIRKVAS